MNIRYVVILFTVFSVCTSATFAEQCDTNCGDQCRTKIPPPQACNPFGGGCISIGGGAEFIEPTCNAKCLVARKAACVIGRPIPNVPLSIKEQVESVSRNLCGISFYSFTGVISAQCSNWDGRLEDQDEIAQGRDLLIQRGYFTKQDFDDTEIRWCPLDQHTTGIAPSRGKIYLNTSWRHVPTDTLAPLLAHEMIHQRQYRNAGDDQFRCDYSRQMIECGGCQNMRHSMEREAYSFENRVRAELGSTRDFASLAIVADRPQAKIPTRVFVEGFNGPTYVRGLFQKVGEGRWSETSDQSDVAFSFTSDSESPEEIILRDDSRNLVLDMDLIARTTRWRLGNAANWKHLYDVTSADSFPTRVFFQGKNGPNFVRGSLQKAPTGKWVEKNDQTGKTSFDFAVILERPEGIILQDKSRHTLLEVNLRSRKISWRLETEGSWHALYDVVGSD